MSGKQWERMEETRCVAQCSGSLLWAGRCGVLMKAPLTVYFPSGDLLNLGSDATAWRWENHSSPLPDKETGTQSG